MAQFRGHRPALGMQNGNKRNVNSTVNQPPQQQGSFATTSKRPVQSRGGGQPPAANLAATTGSQDLSSSPFKKLKTSHGPPPGGGAGAAGSSTSYGSTSTTSRPLSQKTSTTAATSRPPQVRESKPWKTPQWQNAGAASTPKRRDTKRQANYYEGYFNQGPSPVGNQLLFASNPPAAQSSSSSSSVSSSTLHQGFPSHAPPPAPPPTSASYRGGGGGGHHQPLALQPAGGTGGVRPIAPSTTASSSSASTYRPNPITSRTLPASANRAAGTTNGRAPTSRPNGSAAAVAYTDLTVDAGEDGDGFTLKSLDFRGSQNGIVDGSAKAGGPQLGDTMELAMGSEADPFADDVFAMALAVEEEEKARKERGQSYHPVPLNSTATSARTSHQPPPSTTTSASTSIKQQQKFGGATRQPPSHQSLAPSGRGRAAPAASNQRHPAAASRPSAPHTTTAATGVTKSTTTAPARQPQNQPQQQQQHNQQQQLRGNRDAPIVLAAEKEARMAAADAAIKNESSNSESYDEDSGWLYEAIIAESDMEKEDKEKKKRKRENGDGDKRTTPSRGGNRQRDDSSAPADEGSTTFSGDSLFVVPQTGPSSSLSTGIADDVQVRVKQEPSVMPVDGGFSDDLIFVQALEQVEGEKRSSRKEDSLSGGREPGGVPASAVNDGDDILSINPLASTGLSVPEHIPSSSSDTPPFVPEAKGKDEIERARQENYRLALEKAKAEEEKERMEQEMMHLRRQMQQMKAEKEANIEHLRKNVKHATENLATLEQQNTTLCQQLEKDSRSLQRQINALTAQLSFKDKELAGAEETKRRLLGELEEERKKKALAVLPTRRDDKEPEDDDRLRALAGSKREKKRASSGVREAEERAKEIKSHSSGLASLVRMSEVSVLHHLLDEDMSGHLFALLGSETVSPARPPLQPSDTASTESSAGSVLMLFRNHSSQSLNESQAEHERNETREKRRKLSQELRMAIAKVLYERASLAAMLPILGDFLVLLKKRSVVGLHKGNSAKERNGGELSTSTSSSSLLSTASSLEESATMSLLFSALSVLHVIVRGSGRCRRAILWDEKDEVEEREKQKAECVLAAGAIKEEKPGVAVKTEQGIAGGAVGAMVPHGRLRNSRILVGSRERGGDDKMEVEGKGKEKDDSLEANGMPHLSVHHNRSLTSLFLLGQDSEPESEHDNYGESEHGDFFAMLAQRDSHANAGEGSVASEDRFQLLPAYLDAVRERQNADANRPQGNIADGKSAEESTLSAKELLQQARVRHGQVHAPKLLGLLINRVLKRREISLIKHGEVISMALQVLDTLSWHCPPHLLHKFEPLFTTNLLFSFLGRTSSLPIKELTVDILLNLFRNPSFLPMLKKTANGGLTLLDRAIKYLAAEQYEPAEIRSLRSKVVRLVSLVEMKYKDVCFEVLHSKKEKATNLFVSLGISLCAEVEVLQGLPHSDPSTGTSAALIREIVNLLLLLINHLGSEAATNHATPALHYYHRATNLLASQAVHPLVADLVTSAAHVHASIFRQQHADAVESAAAVDARAPP